MRQYMSTGLDPRGSDAVEIAARKVILSGSAGHAQPIPLTNLPAMTKQPSAGLGPVTVHPTLALALGGIITIAYGVGLLQIDFDLFLFLIVHIFDYFQTYDTTSTIPESTTDNYTYLRVGTRAEVATGA